MKKISKPAGFWIRVSSIFIDFIIFATIAISLSLIAISKNGEKFEIIDWAYYLWMVLIIIEILILFIIIPILLKGRTIGMICCQIKMISVDEKPIWITVLNKNKLYSFLWIFTILVSMSFISPHLAQKMTDISNQPNDVLESEKIKMTILESSLLAIPTTTSGIVIFVNVFMTLSINMNKNMRSINDKISNSQIVYSKKTIEVFDEINKVILREKREDKEIVWKE